MYSSVPLLPTNFLIVMEVGGHVGRSVLNALKWESAILKGIRIQGS